MGISTMARVGVLRVYAWRIGSGLRGGGDLFPSCKWWNGSDFDVGFVTDEVG